GKAIAMQQQDRPLVSRRSLLKGLGAGAIAAAAPRVGWAQEGKSNMSTVGKVMGAGEHTYELVKDWGKLPAGVSYGYTHGVCEDSQGRIYIHNQSKDSVIVFDADGTFIKSWGEEYAQGAHGLQLSKEGNEEFFYLAPTNQHF